MKQYLMRFIRLIFGLFLYALGIVAVLEANVGYAPWEVFHAGLSQRFGISYGLASILVGVAIGVIVVLMGEKLGAGTVLNMVLIGVFVDLIQYTGLFPEVPRPEGVLGLLIGVLILVSGLFLIAIASYFYIGSGFGAGPRDSLMVAMTRKTGIAVGMCRIAVEASALAAGWLLGGLVGIGTVISVFGIGFCIQVTFRLFKFTPTSVEHETIDKTYRQIKSLIKGERSQAETDAPPPSDF